MALSARIRSVTKPGRLDKFSKHAKEAIATVMESHADRAIDIMRIYPPPKPNSSYIRTGDLGRGWSRTNVRETSNGLIVTVHNEMYYSVRVHGDEQGMGQWEMHEDTGWPLVAEVLREDYRDRLRRVIRAL